MIKTKIDNIGRKSLFLLIFLLVVAFILRLNLSIGAIPVFDLDSTRDIYMAREIAIHGAKNIPDSECAGCSTGAGGYLKNSNFYFYFLSVPYFIFKSALGVYLFNIFNGVFFCLLVFLIAKKVFNERVAFFSLFVAVFSNFIIHYNVRINQSYYIATFSALSIWFLLKDKFIYKALALILAFVSVMIHFSSIPLLIFVCYKIVTDIKKYQKIQKLLILTISLFFIEIFIKSNINFNGTPTPDENLLLSIRNFSLLNIFYNLRDIYTNILFYKILFYFVLLVSVLNIKKFKYFFPLLVTLLVTGIFRINEFSGYYSVYYFLFLISIGLSFEAIYQKNKYIAILFVGLFLYKCHLPLRENNFHKPFIQSYLDGGYQKTIIQKINELNPKNLPVTAAFENSQYIFPFYYYANEFNIDDYLTIKNNLRNQSTKEGIIVCDDQAAGVCPYIESTKGYKKFSFIGSVEGYSFYRWNIVQN